MVTITLVININTITTIYMIMIELTRNLTLRRFVHITTTNCFISSAKLLVSECNLCWFLDLKLQ